MSKWADTLLVIGFVLCIPLWIPAALVAHTLDKHRLRKAASAFACVTCGRILDREALARADEAWSEAVAELMRENPGARFRLLRTLDAICPNCGTRYTFGAQDRTFVIEEPWPSGVHA